MNHLLSVAGLLALCLTWAVIGAAVMWHCIVYRPRVRQWKMKRIAREVQAELDATPAPWWERYLKD